MFNQYHQQVQAKKSLKDVSDNRDKAIAIHYSCESFYDRPDGKSPRITSIAVRNLGSAQTISFSIHKRAERKQVEPADIPVRYDELEKEMLEEFYEYVKDRPQYTWLHWNMRDINYGFQALSHRFEVLKGIPVVIQEDRLCDMAKNLKAIYGSGYSGDPRMKTLCEQNDFSLKDFLSGSEEADAFENEEFVKLHQSTLRKVHIFDNLLSSYERGELKTLSSWWYVHGGRIYAIASFFRENPIWAIISGLITIAGIVLAALAF